VRRRWALALTLLVVGGTLWVLSGFVWFVRVRGADRIPAEEVRAALARLGLATGTWRASLDASRLGRELPLLVPGVAWAGVNLHGVVAVVDVAEEVRAAPAYEEALRPGDLVARQAGVVAAITVLSGQAEVRPGDHVVPGQVLIRGVSRAPWARDRQSGILGVREVPVHAQGIVLARRWYAASARTPRTVEVDVPTGRVFVRLALLVGTRALYLAGWGRVPFRHYVLSRRLQGPWRLRGLELPLVTAVLRYAEVRTYLRRLSVVEAEAEAAARARQALLPRLRGCARILEERQRAVVEPGDRVAVEVAVACEENIGVFRPAGDG
jgi:sporulation protein YqfD